MADPIPSPFLQRLQLGQFPLPPIAKLLGIGFKLAEPGRVVMEMKTGAHLHNPMGTVHGGVLGDLADAAMGMAHATTLAEGEAFTTVELKINFLKAVRQGQLTADARVIKTGRTLGLVECHVRHEQDGLVAHATSTCMTLRSGEGERR
ncbi:MAG TPA: PaaI family thioesterase [bacterium]|nr:PaaI family thioesterase [bacterium]